MAKFFKNVILEENAYSQLIAFRNDKKHKSLSQSIGFLLEQQRK